MSSVARTNAYRSSSSVIVSGPGTMYNEITRPKSYTKQYNENTNTYNVTAQPISGLRTKSKSHRHTAKVGQNKSKARKNTNK
mgnify:CR=1 FL=1